MSTDLITEIANLYAGCHTYSDRGVTSNMSAEALTKNPDLTGTLIRFQTEFVRNEKFNFEFIRLDSTEKLGILHSRYQTLARAGASESWHVESLSDAVEKTLKTSKGATGMVPMLLMFELRKQILSPLFQRQYEEKRPVQFADRHCRVLASVSDEDSMTIFIDAESNLIKVIEESYVTTSNVVRSHLHIYEEAKLASSASFS